MQDAPERIWVAGTPQECGQYFPSCVEAEGAWGGVGVEYTRTDLCITEAECQRRIDAAVLAERDACAKTANCVTLIGNSPMQQHASLETACTIRDAIRARGAEMTGTQALRDLLVKVECNICHGSRQVKVGWSPVNNIKVRVEYDPCPNCTPGPHSFHAKQTADHIRALIAHAPDEVK